MQTYNEVCEDVLEEYDDIMEEGMWLEDMKANGHQFSRYSTTEDKSVILCHDCCTSIEDDYYKSHECED